jgi:hypothetical protein
MKNYLPSESDQDSLTRAQLLIYVDQDGKIAFGSDWEDTELGIDAIASMFFSLKHEDLIEKILTVLYKQCVVEERVDVFNQILNSIHSKILNNTDKNITVVRPTAQGEKYV